MNPDLVQTLATVLFAVALAHTFATKQFERLSHRYPRHAGLFHLLGEVEVVFGFWAIVLVLLMALAVGGTPALAYAESRNYTEPLFVFVVMVIAGSRPVLNAVLALVSGAARLRAAGADGGQHLAVGQRLHASDLRLESGLCRAAERVHRHLGAAQAPAAAACGCG